MFAAALQAMNDMYMEFEKENISVKETLTFRGKSDDLFDKLQKLKVCSFSWLAGHRPAACSLVSRIFALNQCLTVGNRNSRRLNQLPVN